MGGAVTDTFIGSSGTEVLNGGYPSINDVFIIGQGSTTAYGGYGNNVFSYASGDGAMTISDSQGTNTLQVGSGLTSSQLTYTASGNDLLITDGTNHDQIRLLNQLSQSNGMQTLAFAGGSPISLEGLALTVPAGTSVSEWDARERYADGDAGE